MGTTSAATTHDQQKISTPTRQMPQGQTYGQRQPEHVSESSPPLHRYLGNSYVQATTTRTQRLGLQTKLTVNEPGDIYEREADRVADQVMAAPTHANISSAPLQIQRFSEPSPGQGDTAPASVAQTLDSPGRQLEPALRQDMEQRFGHDFSRVRVHTDTAAEQSAWDVHARAYTMGHHIVFGAGRFAPETKEGRRLIAHELTHVAQMSAFGSPPGITPGLRLPILRQPESGADADAEERRRRWLAALAFAYINPQVLFGNVPQLIDWARKEQSKFEAPQRTDEERGYIARQLLGILTELRELEGKAEHDPDGALVHSYILGDQKKPWTQDRAHKLDEIAPFTAANIAEWRQAAAWQPPVTVHAKQPPKKKTPPREQPAELPERRSFAVNVTFPKQEGMTLKTEAGQRRIAFALIAGTRPGRTEDQIAWAISRIDLSKWWAPPGNLDLPTWQENFEATAIGDKVTMELSEKFTLELDNILREVPSPRDFQLEGVRQAVLSAAPTTYLAYAAPAGLMAGTIIGSGLAFLPGTGTVGGGGLTTGGGGLLAGGEGSLLLGGTIRQSALYAGRYLYLNAPRLYADTMLYTGAITSGVALAEHLREVRSRGARWSDLPRLAQDFAPFFLGYSEWRVFRGGGPQNLGEEPPGASVPPPTAPPVSGPKPIPAKVGSGAPPTGAGSAPVGSASTATGSRLSPFPRRNLIPGQFPPPPAKSVAPAPARPVTPPAATGSIATPAAVKPPTPAAPAGPPTLVTRLKWRFRDRWLAEAIRGAELADVAPGIGAGGTPGAAGPTPTIIAKPSPAAPTPAPPVASTPAPTRVVGPPKVVTPSAPSRPTTTGGAVGTPVSASKPLGKMPKALPENENASIRKTPPVNENAQSAARKRADARWRPQTQPQQQVQEQPLAATGTDVTVAAKVVESSGTQQYAPGWNPVASRQGTTPGRGAPIPGAVRTASETPAPAQTPAPSTTPSQRAFDDNDPTNVDRSPYGASQGQMTALESFLKFLYDEVWPQEQNIREMPQEQGEEAVYDLYRFKPGSTTGTEVSNTWSEDYLRALEALAQELGFPRLTEDEEGNLVGRPGSRGGRMQFSLQQGDPETGFLHFYNRKLEVEPNRLDIVERIYLSVRPGNALEVMHFVTRELVNNAHLTEIGGAKIAGPKNVGQRRDAIVIYSEGADFTRRALDKILEYQRTHPTYFDDFPMPMARPIAKGVSVGSDPVGSSEAVSFGSLRAEAIYEALIRAWSWQDFFDFVVQSFRRRRIDPDRPERNLPPPTPSPRRPTRR